MRPQANLRAYMLTAQIKVLQPAPTPEPYKTYKKGSKGKAVTALHKRLIELKYLAGKPESSYTEKTVIAITAFQQAEGLDATGIADNDTQVKLFAEDTMENPNPVFDPSGYSKMNYKNVARNPDSFIGDLITFSGKVIQVIEGTDGESQYRIATSGSYEDVVLVSYTRPEGASRVLEDDKVTVYGLCLGVFSYQSTMGATITIPACLATSIEIK